MARKCAYCGGPHRVSARVAEENPFCNACLPERVERRASQLGRAEIVAAGDYLLVFRQPLMGRSAPAKPLRVVS